MKRALPLVAILLLLAVALPWPAAAYTPVVRVWPSPQTFSPDRDGFRDNVTFIYQLSHSSRVYFYVYKGTTLVKRIIAGSYVSAGRHRATWNGRDYAGRLLPNGTYRYRMTSRSSAGVGTYANTVVIAARKQDFGGRWVGFFVPGVPSNTTPLATLESKVATRSTVVNYFQSTQYGFSSWLASNVTARGATPMVTLEFWKPGGGARQSSYSLSRIASGAFDSYLTKYADDAKAFGKVVWLRPFHEMNGNWYPWGGTVNGNSARDFILAWRRVKQIFAGRGATNVKFVWCPNAESVPNTTGNAITRYYPGNAYVDYMAIDGYNFGTSSSWSRWRSFSQIFGSAYTKLAALNTKPIFIAETASVSQGGDKSAWIKEMFYSIEVRYPRTRGVVWFNSGSQYSFKVEQSAWTLQAFKAGAATFNP